MGPVIADLSAERGAEVIVRSAMNRALRSGAALVVAIDGESPRRRWQRLVREMERALAALPSAPRVDYLSGPPGEARKELVRRTGASLFVAAPGVVPLLLARTASVPVLIVRDEERGGAVIGATDFSDTAFPALAAAATEAHQLSRPLILCHIIDEHTRVRLSSLGLARARADVEKHLEEYASARSISATVFVADGDPVMELTRLIREEDAALIVLARRKTPRGVPRFTPAVGDIVAFAAGCSVLVVGKSG